MWVWPRCMDCSKEVGKEYELRPCMVGSYQGGDSIWGTGTGRLGLEACVHVYLYTDICVNRCLSS